MKFQGRTLLLWLFLCVFCSSILFSSCSDSCNGENCPPQNPGKCTLDNTSIPLGQTIYRTATILNGSKAVDICFVVSAARSMNGAQRWLQIAVPIIEEQLKLAGVGNESSGRNRYCLVQFGGRGQSLTAKFLPVDGQTFFPANNFVRARRQLSRRGDVADGYEALEFTARNAPFRHDKLVAKILILVTNMGRSVLSTKTNLTRESVYQVLHSEHVILDTVISATMELNGTAREKVLGLNKLEKAIVVRPNGNFRFVSGNVLFTSSAGQTIHDYVALSLQMGGLSFPINLLAEEDSNVLMSFGKAFIAAHKLTALRRVHICQQCTCKQKGEDTKPECEQATNQELCNCLANGSAIECGIITPTPTVDVTSILSPAETPVPLKITGNVAHTPDGDVEITFRSNTDRMLYDCILLNDSITTPAVIPCRSPYTLKHLVAGRHRALILGKYRQMQTIRLFTFEVPPISGPLQATIVQQSVLNGSVLVNFSANREDVAFKCSIGEGAFQMCSGPLLVDPETLGEELIIVAVDSSGRVAVTRSTIETPPPPTTNPGPVMITVSTDLPDLYGRLRIRFNTSRPVERCFCRINSSTIEVCKGEYLASPEVLGPWGHELTIVCSDADGYNDVHNLKFTLQPQPQPPKGQLQCNLTLTGSNDSVMVARFQCDRRVIATCQASNRAPESCNEVYEFDLSGLGAGSHVFILNVDDGFGGSLMKIYPFSVGTAQRKCCPAISSRNSTAIPRPNSTHVNLDVSVTLGNCSRAEGFSYVVTWGDGASETGTSSHLADIRTSRQYSATGNFTVEVTFCNHPADDSDICCDTLSLPVHLHSSS